MSKSGFLPLPGRPRVVCGAWHGTFALDGLTYGVFESFASDRASAPERHPPSCEGVRPLDLLRIIIAIILPPLGVFLQEGIGKHFWINILLTLLGYIPGIVHAVWIIAKR